MPQQHDLPCAESSGLSRRDAFTLATASALGAACMPSAAIAVPGAAERADVRDFGAVGDGVTDDTAALQAALDASRCVELRPGTYHTTAALEIDSGHILLGCGSTLTGVGHHVGIRRRYGTDFIEQQVVRDLKLDSFSTGLDAEGMSWGNFQNLFTSRCQIGYRLATGNNGICYYNTFTSCHVYVDVDVGVVFEGMENARFGGVSGANTNLFQGCKFGGESVCVDVHAPVSNLAFTGCSFERGRAGIRLLDLGTVNDAQDVPDAKVLKAAFFGCRFEGGADVGGSFVKGLLRVGEHSGDCSFFGSTISGGVTVDDQGLLTNWLPLQGAGGHHQVGFAMDVPGPVTTRNLVLDNLPVRFAAPGDVLVIARSGRLRRCSRANDTRVAGVLVSRTASPPGQAGARGKVASVGPILCRVDAAFGAIKPGDLLTTSRTRGHAMKAGDASKVVGAILGKALERLPQGRGLIRVLMTMQ